MKLRWFPVRSLLIFSLGLFVCGHSGSSSQTPRPETAPRLVVQLGNLGGVGLVALSPNGKLALTAEDNSVSTQDFSICLWEVQTGREIRRFSNHTKSIRALAFSHDNRFAASASNDRTARVWNVETGEEVGRFDHTLGILTVSFSPDGNTLLTTTTSDIFNKRSFGYLWEIATGKKIATLAGHGLGIPAAAYANNGKLIATGSWDQTVRIWGPEGLLLRELKGLNAPVASLAFSADSKLIAIGTSDNAVRLLEADTGHELKKITTPSSPRSVSFSPDNHYLLNGGTYPDQKVHLWDLKTGIETHSFPGTDQATLSADGKFAFVSGTNFPGAPASLWSIETGKLVRSFQGYATGVLEAEVSSDSNYLVTLGEDGNCHLWNLQAGSVQSISEGLGGNADQGSFMINSAVFTPDGKSLVTAERDDFLSHQGGGIQLWDVETGDKTKRLKAGAVGSIGISADGKFAAAGKGVVLGTEADHSARWLQLDNGNVERTFQAHTSTVKSIALSEDGRFLLTAVSPIGGEIDDPPRLWDLKSGRELYRLTPLGPSDPRADAIALSPDGSLAATAHHTGKDEAVIVLWDTASGKETLTLKASEITGFAAQVNAIAFSADGQRLASAGNDRTVRLWDVANGRELKRFEGHADSVRSVKFAPDKRHLISAGKDATVRIWSLETEREICRLISFNDENTEGERWVVVAPDGRFDTNNLNKIRGLHWVLPDAPLSPLPLEIYMRDYYEPQLLPRLLRCEVDKNCDAEFKPLRDLAKLNRVLPDINITTVTRDLKPGVLDVTIEVGKSETAAQRVADQTTLTTGVYDLRLFLDNQLVGYSALNYRTAQSPSKAATTPDAELQEWRAATEIKLRPDGKQTLSFTVPLPNFQNSYRGLELSAYAYNADRVKSETVRWGNAQQQAAPLQEAPAQRRAYIISVGVNASQVPQWQLKYAANDAREFQRVVTAHLNQTSQADVDESLYADETSRRYARQSFYYDIVPVPLIADDELRNGKSVEIRDATKAKIQAVFDVLAGKPVSEDIRKTLPSGEQLRKATPDDLVLISFSCHGYADSSGNFYLLPYDIQAGKDQLPEWQSAVSSDELSLWLRDVDAGDMALVIDACYAAAFAGVGFKPGPMGSRGLGQLAFDKGMLVLAATQASEAAVETGGSIQQGLLSYALVHDGLETGMADNKPKNNQLTLKEWLRYAVGRVPQLNREAQNGKLKAVNAFAITQNKRYQQPSLFDFTPKRLDVFLSKQPPK